MSRIRIVRNSAGNCINFVGTDNPTYWNACLRGEVNADDADRVNVVNTVQSYGSDIAYAFYAIPYYRFCDADGNDFANAQECADYITAQANVSGATAGYELTDQDTLDFRRDPTDTTIIISDGEYYPVNILLAEDAGDGTITIREQGENGNILYTGLRPLNATINGAGVSPVLEDAVNELNALFNVESIVTPGVTTIINNYYYFGDDTIDPFGTGNEREPPWFNVPVVDEDGDSGDDNPYNNGFTTNATGDYFIFPGLAANTDAPYVKGNYMIGLVPDGQDVDDFHTHTAWEEDLTWWVEITDQGYTQNAGTTLNPDTLTSGVAYGSGSSIATQFRIGRGMDNRLIVEGSTVPWGTTPTETQWFEVIRTNQTVAPASKWRFVWKAMTDNTCIDTSQIIAVDGENALTYYYIESPDTVFYYPIFTTAAEAEYHSADSRLGAGDGSYTPITFTDVPGNVVYYVPNFGSTLDGTYSGVRSPIHPRLGNGYDNDGIYWTEIPTEPDNVYIPSAFDGSDYIFDETTGVNIIIEVDGGYTTTVSGLPNSLTYSNGNITGSAPVVTGTLENNPADTYTVEVTRTNSYGSSVGTFTIQVNNLTAPPTAITGWTWDNTSEELVDELTLNEGSVACIDTLVSEDYRMIISTDWINTNVLPYLQEAGDAIYIGAVRDGMSVSDYTDPANVDDLDWEAYIKFEYVSPTSHRSTLYGYHNGAPETDAVLSASLTSTTYSFGFENDDHGDLYVIAANSTQLNTEQGIDYGGVVDRKVETFNIGDVEICMVTVGCSATIATAGIDVIRIPLSDTHIRINEPTDNPETYTFDTATATGLIDMPTLQAGQTYTFHMGANDLSGLEADDILCFTTDGSTEYTGMKRAAMVGTAVNPVLSSDGNMVINGRNIGFNNGMTLDQVVDKINLDLGTSPRINILASNNGTGQLRLRSADDTTTLTVANNGANIVEQLGLTETTVNPASGIVRAGTPGVAGTTVEFTIPVDVPVPLYWHIGPKTDMDTTTVEEVIVTGSIWPNEPIVDPTDSSGDPIDPADPDYEFPDPVIGLTTGSGFNNGTAIEVGLIKRGQRMVFSHDFIRHLMSHMPLYNTPSGGPGALNSKNRIYLGIIADSAHESNVYGTDAMLETRLSTARYPDAGDAGWGTGTENVGMGSAVLGNSALWFEKSTYDYASFDEKTDYDPLVHGTHQARGFFTTAMNLGRISIDPGTEDSFDEWAYAIEFSPEAGDDNLYYLADPDENLLYTLPGDWTDHQEWSMYDEQRMSDVIGGGSTSNSKLAVPAAWSRYFSQDQEDNGNDPWLVADPGSTPAGYGYRVFLIAEGVPGSWADDVELDMHGVETIAIPVANPISQTSTHAWDGKGSNYWSKLNLPYNQGGISLTENQSNVFYSDPAATPSAPNSTNATSPDGYPWAFSSVFQMNIPSPTTKQTLFTVGGDPVEENGVFSILFDGHYIQLIFGYGNNVWISEQPDFYFRHNDWYGLYVDYNGAGVVAGTNTSFRIHNVNLSTGNTHSIELDFNEFRQAGYDDLPNVGTGPISYNQKGLDGNQHVGVYPVMNELGNTLTRTNYWLGNIAQVTQTTLPVNSILPNNHEIALMTRDPLNWMFEYKETNSSNNEDGIYRLPTANTNSTGWVSGTGDDGYLGTQVYRFGDGLPNGQTFAHYQIPNEMYSNQENTPSRLGGSGNTPGCIISVTIPGITVDPGYEDPTVGGIIYLEPATAYQLGSISVGERVWFDLPTIQEIANTMNVNTRVHLGVLPSVTTVGNTWNAANTWTGLEHDGVGRYGNLVAGFYIDKYDDNGDIKIDIHVDSSASADGGSSSKQIITGETLTPTLISNYAASFTLGTSKSTGWGFQLDNGDGGVTDGNYLVRNLIAPIGDEYDAYNLAYRTQYSHTTDAATRTWADNAQTMWYTFDSGSSYNFNSGPSGNIVNATVPVYMTVSGINNNLDAVYPATSSELDVLGNQMRVFPIPTENATDMLILDLDKVDDYAHKGTNVTEFTQIAGTVQMAGEHRLNEDSAIRFSQALQEGQRYIINRTFARDHFLRSVVDNRVVHIGIENANADWTNGSSTTGEDEFFAWATFRHNGAATQYWTSDTLGDNYITLNNDGTYDETLSAREFVELHTNGDPNYDSFYDKPNRPNTYLDGLNASATKRSTWSVAFEYNNGKIHTIVDTYEKLANEPSIEDGGQFQYVKSSTGALPGSNFNVVMTTTGSKSNSYNLPLWTNTVEIPSYLTNQSSPTAITGFEWIEGTDTMEDSDTLNPGSVVCATDIELEDGKRIIVNKTWVDTYILPQLITNNNNLAKIYFGISKSDATWENNFHDDNFHANVRIDNVGQTVGGGALSISTTNHIRGLYQRTSTGGASNDIATINSATDADGSYAFQKVGNDIWILRDTYQNLQDLILEPGNNPSGTFASALLAEHPMTGTGATEAEPMKFCIGTVGTEMDLSVTGLEVIDAPITTPGAYGADGFEFHGGMIPNADGEVWPSALPDRTPIDKRLYTWICLGDRIQPGERIVFDQNFMHSVIDNFDAASAWTIGLLANSTSVPGFTNPSFGGWNITSPGWRDPDPNIPGVFQYDGIAFDAAYDPKGNSAYYNVASNPTGLLGDTGLKFIHSYSGGNGLMSPYTYDSSTSNGFANVDFGDSTTSLRTYPNGQQNGQRPPVAAFGYIELSSDGTKLRQAWAGQMSYWFQDLVSAWDPETEDWEAHGQGRDNYTEQGGSFSVIRWEVDLPSAAPAADVGIHIRYDNTRIDLDGDASAQFGNTAVIDYTAPTVINSPTTEGVSSATSWDKGLDLSGTNDSAWQHKGDRHINPLRMYHVDGAVAPNADASLTVASGPTPWITSCVFQPGGHTNHYGSLGGRIWSMSNSFSNYHNISLVEQDGHIWFKWGYKDSENEIRIIENASTSTWYGVYIGFRGQRDYTPSAAFLGQAFDIYVMSSADSFGSIVGDVSTSSEWGQSHNTTGQDMATGIDSSTFNFGNAYGTTGHYQFNGKIASFVVSSQRNGIALPNITEITSLITDPQGWLDGIVGTTRRRYDGNEFTFALDDFNSNWATQVYLMGDGSTDNISNGIRNRVWPTATDTAITLYNIEESDIGTLNIPGLT